MATKKTDPASRGMFNYASALKGLNKSAFPLAVRGTLNALAYETRENIVGKQMPKKFTLRNKFEQNAVRFGKSRNTFRINEMESVAGQLASVNFGSGRRDFDDMKEQELGKPLGPRQGSTMVRTPTLLARKGKAFNQPVSKQNRPGTGEEWLSVDDVARIAGVTKGQSDMNTNMRIRRAYALVRKYSSKFNGRKLIIPSQNGKVYVYKVMRGKPKLLHVLQHGKKVIKKRETVKPAFQTILKTRADQIFREQADRRVKAHIKKRLGLG